MINLSDCCFVALSPEIDTSSFDCGDPEINKFLLQDALHYQNEKIGNTYLFQIDNNSIVAYFTIANACINDLGKEKGYTNRVWNKFHRKISLPNPKRIRTYPAIKVGRIGIDTKFQGMGLGSKILEFIKGWGNVGQKPACRLLILDAYNKEMQLSFYQKNEFYFLLDDIITQTRLMYYDLAKLQ